MKPSPGRRGDPVWLPEVLRHFGVKVVEDPGWKLWGMGDFGAIWGVVAHHTGANNTSTDFIRYNPMLGNGLSSQIHLSRTGVVTLVGAGIAWHSGQGSYPGIAANNANAVTIGIEAQGDGQTWPDVQMDAYHRTCAAICWYLGLDSGRVIAHHEWAGAAQGKWDPGLNGKPMPMGPFRSRVQHYINNPPAGGQGGITVSEADRIITHMTDFIKGYVGPLIEDSKDTRGQLTGSRDSVPGDPQASYPGWPQLGQDSEGRNLTMVDGLAAARRDIAELGKRIDRIEGK